MKSVLLASLASALLLSACATTQAAAPAPAPAAEAPKDSAPSSPPPAAPEPPPQASVAPTPPSLIYTFEGTEVFGSRKVPKAELLEVIALPPPGTKIDMAKGDFGSVLIASKARLTAKWPFALCNYSLVGYPATQTLRVTVDLVDVGDEWRMKFTPAPKGDVADPAGLVAAWSDYLKALERLQKAGAVPNHGGGTCRAFVCHGGFAHPDLAPREQQFVDGVPAHFDALVAFVAGDKDEQKRMAALQLLSYAPSREAAVKAVVPFVRDEQQGVRNEALRLLGAAQNGEKQVIIPLDTVLDALWLPRSTDRNKAGWALVRIVEVEGKAHRREILEKAGEVLVQMAGMQQKIDHEPAVFVLERLSGERYGHDEAAWRAWVEKARAGK